MAGRRARVGVDGRGEAGGRGGEGVSLELSSGGVRRGEWEWECVGEEEG